MTITVNGEERDVEPRPWRLWWRRWPRGAAVATALNGAFVAKAKRDRAAIRPGDRIEILAPMQGG